MDTTTARWARDKTGKKVHRANCRHGRYPWNWAGDASDCEMAAFIYRNEPAGYQFAACCCGDVDRVAS